MPPRLKIEDYLGKTYNDLTVIGQAEPAEGGYSQWLCKCKCGNERVFRSNQIKRNKATSCGCIPKNTTHGMYYTKIYKMWAGMKNRCYNENNERYNIYGARGIGVCSEWHVFENFHAWASSNGYKEGLTIDRENNEEGYSPNNCRWVTMQKNAENRRLMMSNNSSGYRGVGKKREKFYAEVKHKNTCLLRKANFKTAKEAAFYRDRFVIANNIPLPLNFPELAMQGPL